MTNNEARLQKRLRSLLGEKSKNIGLVGKTVAISGSTGGLGKALCENFCLLGASLLLVDRNREKSEKLICELKERYPHIKAEHITLDLEDTKRAREVADELCSRRVDFLVLNAGAYSIPRHTCACGYDNVFVINFLSPYILVKKTLPSIAKGGGRVVIVGSIAHRYSKTDKNDVDFSRRRAASKVYGNAKRHLMYACDAEEQYRKAVVITHPGIAVTNITAHYPAWLYAIIKYPMKVIFSKPKKACLSTLAGLFSDGERGGWIGPRIFDVWGLPAKRSFSPDETERLYVYNTAEKIYKEALK